MRSTGEPAGWTHAWIVRESYVAFNVSTVDASLIALIPKEEKGFWDYHRNGNLATKVQEDVLAVTHLQKLCLGGGGGGGSLKYHQSNIPVPAGTVNLDTLPGLPAGYVAAFINSCGAATYVDTIPLAYINNSLGNTTCGATMVTPGSHKFELLGN